MVEELQTIEGSVFHHRHIIRLDQKTPQVEMKLKVPAHMCCTCRKNHVMPREKRWELWTAVWACWPSSAEHTTTSLWHHQFIKADMSAVYSTYTYTHSTGVHT